MHALNTGFTSPIIQEGVIKTDHLWIIIQMSRNSKELIKFHVFIELCRYASGRYMYIMYAHVCTKDMACMHLPAASSAYTGMLNKPWAGAHVSSRLT